MRVRETVIRAIGNSAGVTIPKETLEKYDLGPGDKIFLQETADGILVTPFDPLVQQAMAIYRKGAKKYQNAMRELSKPVEARRVMPRKPTEPIWLIEQIVIAIHDDLLSQHGGMFGLRDAGLFASALARPRHRWAYGEATDLFECAASYGFGIAKNHAFNDGNKRTAFQTMYTFLGLNGRELNATEIDAVAVMVGVADGSVTEVQLANWLRKNSTKPRRTKKAAK